MKFTAVACVLSSLLLIGTSTPMVEAGFLSDAASIMVGNSLTGFLYTPYKLRGLKSRCTKHSGSEEKCLRQVGCKWAEKDGEKPTCESAGWTEYYADLDTYCGTTFAGKETCEDNDRCNWAPQAQTCKSRRLNGFRQAREELELSDEQALALQKARAERHVSAEEDSGALSSSEGYSDEVEAQDDAFAQKMQHARDMEAASMENAYAPEYASEYGPYEKMSYHNGPRTFYDEPEQYDLGREQFIKSSVYSAMPYGAAPYESNTMSYDSMPYADYSEQRPAYDPNAYAYVN